jgi:hypothetical protein
MAVAEREGGSDRIAVFIYGLLNDVSSTHKVQSNRIINEELIVKYEEGSCFVGKAEVNRLLKIPRRGW